MREIEKVIIHCSDTPDDKEFDVFDISDWHQKRDFPQSEMTSLFCGYHYVVLKTGMVQVGRGEYEIGAHVAGHNANSIGICWVGRHAMTEPQSMALCDLICNVLSRYALTPKHVLGHCELNPHKTCPNIESLDKFRDHLETLYKEGF